MMLTNLKIYLKIMYCHIDRSRKQLDRWLALRVATGEITFYKLKIIKHYVRTMSTKNCFNGLATMAVEHKLSNKLYLKEVIRDFAETKNFKMIVLIQN